MCYLQLWLHTLCSSGYVGYNFQRIYFHELILVVPLEYSGRTLLH